MVVVVIQYGIAAGFKKEEHSGFYVTPIFLWSFPVLGQQTCDKLQLRTPPGPPP